MVYLLGWCVDTILKAPLTKRVGSSIAVTDTFPCSAVLAVNIGAALVFVVLAAFLHTVLFTKLSFTEVGAAGMRAGSQRFLRHRFTSLGIRKAPRDCSHEAVLDSFSLIISYHNVEVGIYRQRRVFPASFRSESGRWVKPLPKELPYAICEWCFHLRSTLRRSAPRSCCGCSGSGEPCAR